MHFKDDKCTYVHVLKGIEYSYFHRKATLLRQGKNRLRMRNKELLAGIYGAACANSNHVTITSWAWHGTDLFISLRTATESEWQPGLCRYTI